MKKSNRLCHHLHLQVHLKCYSVIPKKGNIEIRWLVKSVCLVIIIIQIKIWLNVYKCFQTVKLTLKWNWTYKD